MEPRGTLQQMRLICKIFGHKEVLDMETRQSRLYVCQRCGWLIRIEMVNPDKWNEMWSKPFDYPERLYDR